MPQSEDLGETKVIPFTARYLLYTITSMVLYSVRKDLLGAHTSGGGGREGHPGGWLHAPPEKIHSALSKTPQMLTPHQCLGYGEAQSPFVYLKSFVVAQLCPLTKLLVKNTALHLPSSVSYFPGQSPEFYL